MTSKHSFVKDESTSGSNTLLIGQVSDVEGDSFTIKALGSSPQGTYFVSTASGEIFLEIDSDMIEAGNYTVKYVVTE